jgi:hypothetical protein
MEQLHVHSSTKYNAMMTLDSNMVIYCLGHLVVEKTRVGTVHPFPFLLFKCESVKYSSFVCSILKLVVVFIRFYSST